MATVGRLLRQQMRDDAAETPERIAERIRYRAAAEQAYREMLQRWPEATPENFRESCEWREERLRELVEAAS